MFDELRSYLSNDKWSEDENGIHSASDSQIGRWSTHFAPAEPACDCEPVLWTVIFLTSPSRSRTVRDTLPVPFLSLYDCSRQKPLPGVPPLSCGSAPVSEEGRGEGARRWCAAAALWPSRCGSRGPLQPPARGALPPEMLRAGATAATQVPCRSRRRATVALLQHTACSSNVWTKM